MDIDLIALVATLAPELPAALVSIGGIVSSATVITGGIRLTLPVLEWLSGFTATKLDDEAVDALGAVVDAVYDVLESAIGWFEPLSLVKRASK